MRLLRPLQGTWSCGTGLLHCRASSGAGQAPACGCAAGCQCLMHLSVVRGAFAGAVLVPCACACTGDTRHVDTALTTSCPGFALPVAMPGGCSGAGRSLSSWQRARAQLCLGQRALLELCFQELLRADRLMAWQSISAEPAAAAPALRDRESAQQRTAPGPLVPCLCPGAWLARGSTCTHSWWGGTGVGEGVHWGRRGAAGRAHHQGMLTSALPWHGLDVGLWDGTTLMQGKAAATCPGEAKLSSSEAWAGCSGCPWRWGCPCHCAVRQLGAAQHSAAQASETPGPGNVSASKYCSSFSLSGEIKKKGSLLFWSVIFHLRQEAT